MTAPDDMITVTLRRDEWGRVRQAMRMLRRKAEKTRARRHYAPGPGFATTVAIGAVPRGESRRGMMP